MKRQHKPIPEALLDTLRRVFAERVVVGQDDECWLWQGAFYETGYGRVIVRRGKRIQHHFLAHRVAYFLATGIDPDDATVRHSCDTPPCVNHGHLLLGSQGDNVADAVARGRMRHGDAHPFAILTEAVVVDARRTYRAGKVSLQVLADRIGADRRTVGEAIRGITWAHLPLAVPASERDGRRKDVTCAQ